MIGVITMTFKQRKKYLCLCINHAHQQCVVNWFETNRIPLHLLETYWHECKNVMTQHDIDQCYTYAGIIV